jgi:hypothetical protein
MKSTMWTWFCFCIQKVKYGFYFWENSSLQDHIPFQYIVPSYPELEEIRSVQGGMAIDSTLN